MLNFKGLEVVISEIDDTNMCFPIALSLTTDNDLQAILDEMEASGSREKGKGTPYPAAIEWMKNHKIKHLDISEQVLEAGGKTPRTLVKVLDPTKKYIAFSKSHALAIIDGKVEDYTSGRLNRVVKVWQIGTKAKAQLKALPSNVAKMEAFKKDVRNGMDNFENSHEYGLSISGGVIRVIWNGSERFVVYIGMGRAGATISLSQNSWVNDFLPKSNFTHDTKRHSNYAWATLNELLKDLAEAKVQTLL